MTSQFHAPAHIPFQYITRANFKRGTLGKDMLAQPYGSSDASIVEKKHREAIQDFSKAAHFQFSASRKIDNRPLEHPAATTHDTFFKAQDNSVNIASKEKVAEQQRVMKASHFIIGSD